MKCCKIQLKESSLQDSIQPVVNSMYTKKEIVEKQLQDTIQLQETKTCFVLSFITGGFDYELDFGLN